MTRLGTATTPLRLELLFYFVDGWSVESRIISVSFVFFGEIPSKHPSRGSGCHFYTRGCVLLIYDKGFLFLLYSSVHLIVSINAVAAALTFGSDTNCSGEFFPARAEVTTDLLSSFISSVAVLLL